MFQGFLSTSAQTFTRWTTSRVLMAFGPPSQATVTATKWTTCLLPKAMSGQCSKHGDMHQALCQVWLLAIPRGIAAYVKLRMTLLHRAAQGHQELWESLGGDWHMKSGSCSIAVCGQSTFLCVRSWMMCHPASARFCPEIITSRHSILLQGCCRARKKSAP